MRKQTSRRPRAAVESLENRLLLSATAVTRALMHPTIRLARHGVSHDLGSSTATGISPAKMRTAYGMNNITFGSITGDGSGQTIALIDAYDDPNALSDLQHFDTAFGLPNPPSFQKLNEIGGTSLPGTDSSTKPNTWELEESLDIEWAHVMAPGAGILLYEANSSSFNDLVVNAVNSARNNPSVTAVSMSFGGSEFRTEKNYDAYFTTPTSRTSGVTFVASTGDGGSPGGYPAYSPNVIAVGGTTLSTDSSGNWTGETAWSGSGGGTSTKESEPSYQTSVQSTGKRTIPDVAMDANPNTGVPVYDTFDGTASTPWFQVGGTSLGAPMWAGLIAVADQGRQNYGLSTLDGRNQALPMIYQMSASNFHDIVSGSNGAFSAHTGYDEVTGRGTPTGSLTVWALVGKNPPPVVQSLSASPNPVTAGSNVNLAATVSDPGSTVSSVAFYRESNGTSGLQTGAGGDTLLGTDSTSSDGWTNASSTSGLSGTVMYYAVATDASGTAGAPAPTSVTVNPASTATATFVKTDTTTQGTWSGVYGAGGYSVVGGTTSLPSYATVSTSASSFTWTASTTDVRAPQSSLNSSTRVAAADFSSTSFSFNLNLTDGKTHQVALYLLDWENLGRAETITFSNASTGAVLNTQSASSFVTGKYLVWTVSGQVTITVTRTGGANAVVSGLFFA